MKMNNFKIQNIAAYKFVDIESEKLPGLRERLLSAGKALDLKGTILLSNEGINLFMAGVPDQIKLFQEKLSAEAPFAGIACKSSFSEAQPFKKMVVKIKDEIITMGDPSIRPAEFSGPHIEAAELKRWLDENRDFTLLDTRNTYEVGIGTFARAIDLNIDSFGEFAAAVEKMDPKLKEKPLVMFCTGGIRCEKAAPLMLKKGFKTVLQLDGGILKYFEDCSDAHYEGECFVFDQRVTVDGNLRETGAVLCRGCGLPFTVEQQQSDIDCDRQDCPMKMT